MSGTTTCRNLPDSSGGTDLGCNFNVGTTSSGSLLGLDYGMETTNGSSSTPMLSVALSYTNPGMFSVIGTAIASGQGTLAYSPSQLMLGTFTENYLVYEQDNVVNASLVPGSTYTCTIFDGNTSLGSTTTVVGGSTSGGTTSSFADCEGVYPSQGASGNGHALVVLPSTYNTGDVYTYIISQ